MEVKWNKSAQAVFTKVVKQGAAQFGLRVAADFANQILANESRLATNPEMGKPEPLLADIGGNYRSLVVHEHYKLIYHIVTDTLRISDFWDTRTDPEQLARRIKK